MLQTGSTSILGPAARLLWDEADSFAKRFIFFTLLLVFSSAAVSGLAPLLLRFVIDDLEQTGVGTSYRVPLYLVAAYASVHLLSRILNELRGACYGRADQRIQRQLSNRLFQHIMALPLRFHLDRRTGAISQTLTNGLVGYRLVLNHATLTVLPVVVELVTMGTVLILIEHAAFLVVIGTSLLFYVVAFSAGVTRIGRPARAASDAHIDAHAVLTDSILNYETVKYFGAEPQMQGRFFEALRRTEDQWSELFARKKENGFVVSAIFAFSLGVSVYLAAHMVRQGTMTIGEFVLVNAYILQITQPLELLGFAFRGIAEGMAFIKKLVELLGEKQETDLLDHPESVSAGPPKLVFDGLSYSYHSGRQALDDVTFVVPSGKTVAIVGVSGSGKSSLIRLLVRLVEPSSGRIWLNDVLLSDIPKSVLRDAIAVVPQDIALFNDSIAYNIGFGRTGSTEADIIRAAKVAHVHDFIAGLPHGYGTMVGERGLKLSGGQKQRVAIARAAIKQPKIFVFDEATSSLDSETERAILQDLLKVANMATTLIIAHRLSTVVHADEIVVLSQGRIIERGSHGELLQQGGTYAAMWRAQHCEEKMVPDNVSLA